MRPISSNLSRGSFPLLEIFSFDSWKVEYDMSQHFLNESMSSLTKTRHRVPKLLGKIQGRSSPGTLKKVWNEHRMTNWREKNLFVISLHFVSEISNKRKKGRIFPPNISPRLFSHFPRPIFHRSSLWYSVNCVSFYFSLRLLRKGRHSQTKRKWKKYHLQRLLWFSSFPRLCEWLFTGPFLL